jgi:hypothetical protein
MTINSLRIGVIFQMYIKFQACQKKLIEQDLIKL